MSEILSMKQTLTCHILAACPVLQRLALDAFLYNGGRIRHDIRMARLYTTFTRKQAPDAWAASWTARPRDY